MRKLTKEQKKKRLRKAIKGGSWYAACEDGHALWLGPDRSTYEKAKIDAETHDKKKHADGASHAAVLSSN